MKRNSEQQARLFVAIMHEAEKETGMKIALHNEKMFIVDNVTGAKFELKTTLEKRKKAQKNRKSIRQRKSDEKPYK